MIKTLKIEQTECTPGIYFDPESNIFEVIGESYPENSAEFYTPVLDWMRRFLGIAKNNISFKLKMTYFNTSSSKYLFEILSMIKTYNESSYSKVEICWFFEEDDEDSRLTGKEYELELGFEFKFIVMDNNKSVAV